MAWTRWLFWALITLGSFGPAVADDGNAPFCTVFAYGKQCWYYTEEACENAAGTMGACILNREAVRPPNGTAPFCVVTSTATNCWFYSADSCRDAAESSGGRCVVR